MKYLKYAFAALLVALLGSLCACKAPEPELALTREIFEAGSEVDLAHYAYVVADEGIHPERYMIHLQMPTAFDPYKLGAQEVVFIAAYSRTGEEFAITKTVYVEDNIAPSFTAKKNTVTLSRNAEFNGRDYFNYSDQGTPDYADAEFAVRTALDTTTAGIYEVTAAATDRGGNTTSATLTVVVEKDEETLLLGKFYEDDGVRFEVYSASFYDTILPTNPGKTYTYIPSQAADGNTLFALRMSLTLDANAEGPVNMKQFFGGSRIYLGADRKAKGFELKADKNGMISSEVTLKPGESGMFYMIFLVPLATESSTEPLSVEFTNFTNTHYILTVR